MSRRPPMAPQPWRISSPVAMLDPPVGMMRHPGLEETVRFAGTFISTFQDSRLKTNGKVLRIRFQVHPVLLDLEPSSACFPVSAHPTLLSPTRARAAVASVRPSDVQNAPLYPSNSASGLSLSSNRDVRVTLLATIPMMASPIDVPNWAMVLNTAPASALVSSENSLLMVTRPTQKSTSADS